MEAMVASQGKQEPAVALIEHRSLCIIVTGIPLFRYTTCAWVATIEAVLVRS